MKKKFAAAFFAAVVLTALATRCAAGRAEAMPHEREYLINFLVRYCGGEDLSYRVAAAGRILDVMDESGLNAASAADIWLRESGARVGGNGEKDGGRDSGSIRRISEAAVQMALLGARG